MASISELIHGRKPEVAPFEPTDPLVELQKLINGEISSWDDITRLSDLYQTYMMGAYENAIPGFSDILKQGGADTASLLSEAAPLIRGEIPEDVKSQVLRSSAFQSLMGGTAGSPMASALSARDLGRTSLDLMNQGANLLGAGGNAAQRWQAIAGGTILPPSQSMYSPEWFSTFMAQQRAAKQATKQFKYNVEAAPDPAWADRAKLLASYGGMALGGGIGGGGGAGSSMNAFSSNYGAANSLGGGYAADIGPTQFNASGVYGTPPPPAPNDAFPLPTGDYKSVIPPQTSYFNQYPYYG